MNRLLLSLSVLVVIFLAWTQSPGAGQAPAPTRSKINVAKLGPQVGDIVPDFNLTDQNGKARTRQSIMGPKGAMLVFVRSADW